MEMKALDRELPTMVFSKFFFSFDIAIASRERNTVTNKRDACNNPRDRNLQETCLIRIRSTETIPDTSGFLIGTFLDWQPLARYMHYTSRTLFILIHVVTFKRTFS